MEDGTCLLDSLHVRRLGKVKRYQALNNELTGGDGDLSPEDQQQLHNAQRELIEAEAEFREAWAEQHSDAGLLNPN